MVISGMGPGITWRLMAITVRVSMECPADTWAAVAGRPLGAAAVRQCDAANPGKATRAVPVYVRPGINQTRPAPSVAFRNAAPQTAGFRSMAGPSVRNSPAFSHPGSSMQRANPFGGRGMPSAAGSMGGAQQGPTSAPTPTMRSAPTTMTSRPAPSAAPAPSAGGGGGGRAGGYWVAEAPAACAADKPARNGDR